MSETKKSSNLAFGFFVAVTLLIATLLVLSLTGLETTRKAKKNLNTIRTMIVNLADECDSIANNNKILQFKFDSLVECNKKYSIEANQRVIIQNLYDLAIKNKIYNPDIFVSQSIVETGWFTSDSYLKGNNLIGMKVPRSRPSYGITGSFLSHAKYKSIESCVIDYKFWQNYYCERFNEYQTYDYLKIYATDPAYKRKVLFVRSLLKQDNLI